MRSGTGVLVEWKWTHDLNGWPVCHLCRKGLCGLCWLEEEVKTRNDFTVEKAKKYIKKNGSKEELKKFEELSKKAEKLAAEYKELKAAGSTDEAKAKQKEMLKESGNAFRSQKKWFKDTYGEDVYDQVRKYK